MSIPQSSPSLWFLLISPDTRGWSSSDEVDEISHLLERIPLWDVGDMCFCLLSREHMGKLRPRSAQSLHSGQLERQGWEKAGVWAGLIGWAPFPENPQLCFTKWSTVSSECLHFAPLLPREILPRGTLAFPRKVASWAKPERSPMFLRSTGGYSWALLRIAGILKLDSGDGCTTPNVVLAWSTSSPPWIGGGKEAKTPRLVSWALCGPVAAVLVSRTHC